LTATGTEKKKWKTFRRAKAVVVLRVRIGRKMDYSLGTANDIVGIVVLEIQSAVDLPRLNDSGYL